MLKVLDEHYFIDLDKVEQYLDIENVVSASGETETKVNLIKFELIKLLLEVVLSEDMEIDEKLGMKSSSSNASVPFRLAFNTLLNKKLISHY
jgi:hypothetical protein